MMHDEEFFQWVEEEGVRPIKGGQRVESRRSARPRLDPRRRAARLAAMGDSEARPGLAPEQLLNPLDPIDWKRDGVQDGVFRNLRLGRYTTDARLDLLRKPLAECADEVVEFVEQCVDLGIRTVLIHFGRSRVADSHANRVKSCLHLWLPGLQEVMAYHGAQPQHGGSGAIYVLLRKSEQQRQRNLERHLHKQRQ